MPADRHLARRRFDDVAGGEEGEVGSEGLLGDIEHARLANEAQVEGVGAVERDLVQLVERQARVLGDGGMDVLRRLAHEGGRNDVADDDVAVALVGWPDVGELIEGE